MNIPYGRQHLTEEDIEAVVNVLRSDFLTQGPKVKEFEVAFANYIGCQYAIAVSSGTAALHLSALALNIRPGDKVITTPITFAASANCVRYCEGDVVFVDIDPGTYLIDVGEVRRLLESSPKGTFKGIVPVDFAGYPMDMEMLRSLANEFGLWIIEDACHAPGGFFVDSDGVRQNCGNGRFADLSIFSFHPVKHIATGEGGMITTNNQELYQKLMMLRSHGITRDPYLFENLEDFGTTNNALDNYPGWYMEMQELGYNYRITDFQCALGLSQLKRANEGLNHRRTIAKRYDEAFLGNKNIHLQSNESQRVFGHAYHLYVIQCQQRRALYEYLRQHGIFSQVHYVPTHLMPYYRRLGWNKGDLEHAEQYYSNCLSLPMYPSLTETEQCYVIQTIEKFFKQ